MTMTLDLESDCTLAMQSTLHCASEPLAYLQGRISHIHLIRPKLVGIFDLDDIYYVLTIDILTPWAPCSLSRHWLD